MTFLIRLLIRGYQVCVSPLLSALTGPNGGCRFQPTCSQYFLEAVETHGVRRGIWLGVKRLMRCHPWGGQGWDPVPQKDCCSEKKNEAQKAESNLSRRLRSSLVAPRPAFSKYGS